MPEAKRKYALDFAEVSAAVDLDRFIAFLDLKLVQRHGNHELRFACPLCKRQRTFCLQSQTREWKCWVCKAYGIDLVALTAAVRDLGMYQAALLLATELLGRT